jgi:hypothetical protein
MMNERWLVDGDGVYTADSHFAIAFTKSAEFAEHIAALHNQQLDFATDPTRVYLKVIDAWNALVPRTDA